MNTKKLLAAAAAILVAGSSIPANMSVFAEGPDSSVSAEETVEGVVFTAESYGDYIKITGFTGSADIAAIPADVNSVPVTALGDLNSNGSIRKLVIPSSVTSISANAFDNVTGLEEIEIDVENAKYASENGVLYNKDMTKLLVYPYAKTDEQFTVPDSVSVLNDGAFSSNICLKELTFGNGIVSVDTTAIALGKNTGIINISASVESLTLSEAGKNNTLTAINADINNKFYSSIDGVLFNKEMTELLVYPAARENASYAVPEGVDTIAENAFSGAKFVTVTVSDDVSIIGKNAFADCLKLSTAVLGNGIKEISEGAFKGNTSLVSVVIGSAETICDNAFYGCKSLKSVSIPENTAEISDSAFNGCTALSNINVSASNKVFSSIDGVLFDKNAETLIKYTCGRKADSYSIPDSVITVGDKAFENCSALTAITLGVSISAFEGNPFNGCTALSNFEVFDGNTVFTAIDGVLFTKSNTNLAMYPCGREAGSYMIPDSLVSFSDNAFSASANITAFEVSETNTLFSAADGVLYSFDGTALVKYPAAAENDYFEIPETVSSIEAIAFENSDALEGLLIANDNTVFAENAFVNMGRYLVLYGNLNSTTKTYASLNSISFIALDAHYAFGDVNADGNIDAVDASNVLAVYALTSTGHRNRYIKAQVTAADIDIDGKVDSSDASKILTYYAYTATSNGEAVSIAEFYNVEDPTVVTDDASSDEADAE